MIPYHDRYDYSLIDDRTPYAWPDGKSMAFYLCNNIEVSAFGQGLGTEIGKVNPLPNHRSYAWREYGNRVGISRILDMVDELSLPMAHNVNAYLYGRHDAIFRRIRQRGDEIVAHGRTNAEIQSARWEQDEKRLIEETTRIIEKNEGKRPAGWLGPWLAESYVTPDLLQEEGYTYLLDWGCDDQPLWMKTRSGRILLVPYSLELNDSPVMAYKMQTASDFADMIVAQFEEMLEQSRKAPLVCSVILHTFVAGQPFRVRKIRQALKHCTTHANAGHVWFTRPGNIAEYCLNLPQVEGANSR